MRIVLRMKDKNINEKMLLAALEKHCRAIRHSTQEVIDATIKDCLQDINSSLQQLAVEIKKSNESNECVRRHLSSLEDKFDLYFGKP